ncbi:fructose-bisphosphate aldolase class I [Candidatus Roizmanbacteria bacterium]|nr:fructose-bisphosphate aldolase class I [Candidatus Roizmanbacteria bacterium]
MNNPQLSLSTVANQLVAPSKGILAADESTGTMTKRLDAIHVESTLENRNKWREIMMTSTGVESYISGVILYDETLRTPTLGGVKLQDLFQSKKIHIGIKVDGGTVKLPGLGEEVFIQGLDKLGKRLLEYKELGATFTKWRAVYSVGENMPSDAVITGNSIALAQYAALVQEAGLVPIVEPEILVLTGSHTIETSKEITKKVLTDVFRWLKEFKVDLKGMLLKPNMVLPGKEHLAMTSADDIAKFTVETLLATVPPEVPGMVFLSGGLNPDQSTEYLAKMNQLYAGKLPWQLSYSYGRALQQEGLQAWSGKQENVTTAQKVFLDRAKKVSQARSGKI